MLRTDTLYLLVWNVRCVVLQGVLEGGGERQWILETSDKIPLQINRIHAGLHVKRCEFPGGWGEVIKTDNDLKKKLICNTL